MGTSYKDLFKLYDVIQNGNEGTLESILKETPVQINQIIPCKGIGLLHLAVGIEPEDKSKKCTELLLKYGGDPNLCNEDGVTPVHIAAIWGRVDNLKLLLGCGGDPARADLDGLSAFEYAARDQQWGVFDYLHNVVDDTDHALASPCAYTLRLERVLLTTDQLVAEYGPIADDGAQDAPAAATDRKSALVNEWCARNTRSINKLYPTILGDTYLLDDESAPWRSTRLDLAHDVTLDLTKHTVSSDTNASFKSCTSKKLPELEISGVHPINLTLDESKESSSVLNKRISVYENFSLPGSPKPISHINYNTKTSLKKKQCAVVEGEGGERSQRLDAVLAELQNRTNEFLSSGKQPRDTLNTRRSSASSGVSSRASSGVSSRASSGVSDRGSSGGVVLAAARRDYRYEDAQERVVLIESRLLVSPVVLSVEEGAAASSADHSVVSVAASLPASLRGDDASLRGDDAALRAELVRRGFTPGPIQDTTRNLYLKKLQALRREDEHHDVDRLTGRLQDLDIDHKQRKKTFSIEVEKSLRNADWLSDLTPYAELEREARESFAAPAARRPWREGAARTCFTYVLLDPRLTDNLPARAHTLDTHRAWNVFVNSIFYVGKGKRSRPYSHLYQALTLWKKEFRTSKDKKVQHILDVWAAGRGVVCLHVFQNVLAAEAYCNEAAMLDALSLPALSNVRPGNYYGAPAAWPQRRRRMLGLYLLYKAMLIFLSEGERQLRPDDLD